MLTALRGGNVRKTGGVIAVVAGGVGVVAAFLTLFIGEVGTKLEVLDAETSETAIVVGGYSILLSLVVTGLGAATIASKGKLCSVLLVIASLAAAMLCGLLVAVFMALAAIGGFVAFFDPNKSVPTTSC